ncbi:FRG domain-containing protein [Marinobacter salexigens]|uniref:FRG domain-containing protein n=1 Tax=Marinobacter salexigens TaxID=1925763 RepID=A0ABS6ACW6_9GAMM|nr:FRG domain-containing protein [Marinobacter salexigens]MBU2875939.1 FRG domain-containing protein [Marinobacter salexigens]
MSYEYEDINIDSARCFFDLILEENIFSPRSTFDVVERDFSRYIFRGQSDISWELKPLAHRAHVDFSKFTPQPPGPLRENVHEYLALHVHAEFSVIRYFLEAADSVGIPTPLDYDSLKVHDYIFEKYNDGDLSWVGDDFPNRRYYPSMAMAQHYGAPTRLLDWTQSPLIAAFFAAEKASSIANERKSSDTISIICLSRHLIDKIDDIEYVPAPRAGNSFLCAQKGCFTLIKTANSYFEKNFKWPDLESVISNSGVSKSLAKPPFLRINIPSSEADELLRLLYRFGISKLTLMPSLQNASDDFNYKRNLWGKVR